MMFHCISCEQIVCSLFKITWEILIFWCNFWTWEIYCDLGYCVEMSSFPICAVQLNAFDVTHQLIFHVVCFIFHSMIRPWFFTLFQVDATFDLDEPIVTQAIVSTGVKFSFIQVQLNTLNLASDDGIKNMVWVDTDNVLFTDNYPVVRIIILLFIWFLCSN